MWDLTARGTGFGSAPRPNLKGTVPLRTGSVEVAGGGRDHGAGDAVPGVAGAGRFDDRGAGGGAEVFRGREPAGEGVGELRDGVGADLEGEPGVGGLGRTASASVRATSPRPEWLATTGRAPQAAASAATIPKASGKVLVTAIASAAGQQIRELGVVQAACEGRHGRAGPRRRRGSRRGPRGARRTPRARGARARPLLACRPAAARSPAASVAVEALQALPEGPEAHDQQPRARLAREHERERRQQQLHALGRDQLAHEDDEPVAGLDRVERRDGLADVAGERGRGRRRGGGRSRGAAARSGGAARRGGRRRRGGGGETRGGAARRGRRGGGRRSASSASRARSAARPAAAASGSRGAKRSTSTPGGRGGCARAPWGRPSRPRGSRRCGASRRARRSRPRGPRPRTA